MTRPHVTVFIATTLDGFIARPDGSLDWLPMEPHPEDEGADYGYAALMASVDALVMGRKTLETVLGFEGPWPYGDTPVVALSTTLSEAELPKRVKGKVRVRAGEPVQILEELGSEGVSRIYLDGGLAVQRFLARGLVDELILTRIPVLIGQGRPLFGPLDEDVRLELLGQEAWPSGMSQVRYRVRRPEPTSA